MNSLRRHYATVLLGVPLAVVIVVQRTSDRLDQVAVPMGTVGADVGHHPWTLLTSPLVQQAGNSSWPLLVLVTVAIVWAERTFGPGLTLIGFWAGDFASTLPVLLGARLVAELGSTSAENWLQVPDSGQSAGSFALLCAAAAAAPRRRTRVIVLGAVVAYLAVESLGAHVHTVQHAVSGLAGALAGTRWRLAGGSRRDELRTRLIG